MSAERDVNRIVRSWIRAEEHESADRVLQTVLSRLDATPQRRSWWPSRRSLIMRSAYKYALAAAAVLVVAVVGYNLLPGISRPGSTTPPTAQPTVPPTLAPSPSPAATPGLTTATITPFVGDDPLDDAIAFTIQYPDGWDYPGGDSFVAVREELVDVDTAWAALLFARGFSLYSEPCRPTDGIDVADDADIEVGPTVAEFVTALDTHPLLDVTTPVDVTVDGYSGKYLVLSAPADISGCVRYRPIGGDTIYAQAPAMRWHLWVLDVQGIRVVIEGFDYPGTSPQHQAELQSIVDSIQIAP